MSAITIAGNTSGSITLAAPDVAGTTTLTLPATSGTVMVNGPAFSAYAGATQTVTINTQTVIAIDTEDFDTNSNFDTSTYSFTPTVAGYYQVNGILRANAASTFTLGYISLLKNGGTIFRGQTLVASLSAGVNSHFVVSGIVYMNGTTDYLQLAGLVNGSGTATFNFSNLNLTSRFDACLVRAA